MFKKVLGKLTKVWTDLTKPVIHGGLQPRAPHAFYDAMRVFRRLSGIIDHHVNRV